MKWLSERQDLFITAVTQAEILNGIGMLPLGKRRGELQSKVAVLFELDFPDRILPFDSYAAVIFPIITAQRRSQGRPIGNFDAQIAAIARAKGATLVTRNTADFEHCGIELVDPWRSL